MEKISRPQFDRLVTTTNPYNKLLHYANITWDGYDYNANGLHKQDAIDNLWYQFLVNNRVNKLI